MPHGKSSRTFKNAAYAHLARVGKALSSPARLEILELLSQAPRTVEVLANEIDQSTANTSHHLQALKRAQLVSSARDGLHITYAIASDEVTALLAQLQRVTAQHVAELEKLEHAFFEDRDGLEPIDSQTLLERMREGDVFLIDVRPEREFERAHIPGATSIPIETLEARLAELPKDRTIVAYCRGPYCAFSADAVRALRELGYDARRAKISIRDLPALVGGLP